MIPGETHILKRKLYLNEGNRKFHHKGNESFGTEKWHGEKGIQEEIRALRRE